MVSHAGFTASSASASAASAASTGTIDLQQAKLYGHTETTIRAEGKQKLLIGQRVPVPAVVAGAADPHLDPVTRARYQYTRNDAYIKSGGTLTITTHDLEVNYGTIYARGPLVFNVANVFTNVAGFVAAENWVDVNAARFEHRRGGTYNNNIGNWTQFYHSCYNQRFVSDAAVLQSLGGSIYFNVKEGTITSSIVRAAANICYNGSMSDQKKPESLKVESTTLREIWLSSSPRLSYRR